MRVLEENYKRAKKEANQTDFLLCAVSQKAVLSYGNNSLQINHSHGHRLAALHTLHRPPLGGSARPRPQDGGFHQQGWGQKKKLWL